MCGLLCHKRVGAGHKLMTCGDKADAFFIVLSGEVEIQVSANKLRVSLPLPLRLAGSLATHR